MELNFPWENQFCAYQFQINDRNHIRLGQDVFQRTRGKVLAARALSFEIKLNFHIWSSLQLENTYKKCKLEFVHLRIRIIFLTYSSQCRTCGRQKKQGDKAGHSELEMR